MIKYSGDNLSPTQILANKRAELWENRYKPWFDRKDGNVREELWTNGFKSFKITIVFGKDNIVNNVEFSEEG